MILAGEVPASSTVTIDGRGKSFTFDVDPA